MHNNQLIVTGLDVTIVSYCDCAVSLSYVAQGEEQTCAVEVSREVRMSHLQSIDVSTLVAT